MISRWSLKIAKTICAREISSRSNIDALAYIFEIWFIRVSSFLCILALVLLRDVLMPKTIFHSLCFILYLVTLRKFAGGYHAKTHLGCLLISTISFFIGTSIVAPTLSRYFPVSFVLMAICICVVFIHAPYIHRNVYATSKMKVQLKIATRVTLVIQVISILTFWYFELIGLASNAVSGMLNATVFLLYAKYFTEEESR